MFLKGNATNLVYFSVAGVKTTILTNENEHLILDIAYHTVLLPVFIPAFFPNSITNIHEYVQKGCQ